MQAASFSELLLSQPGVRARIKNPSAEAPDFGLGLKSGVSLGHETAL